MGAVCQRQTVGRILPLTNQAPYGIRGVSACMKNGTWRYYIAAASSAPTDSLLEEYVVSSCTWAVFPGSGTGASIQELEREVVLRWLPYSGYEFAKGPDIEVYFDPDTMNTGYEVWIPVGKA